MEHSKFDGLRNGLDGNALVERLKDDSEILNQFKEIKARLPPISYASCIELEVLIKEMLDYEIPSKNQWKEIYRLGNMKYNLPVEN